MAFEVLKAKLTAGGPRADEASVPDELAERRMCRRCPADRARGAGVIGSREETCADRVPTSTGPSARAPLRSQSGSARRTRDGRFVYTDYTTVSNPVPRADTRVPRLSGSSPRCARGDGCTDLKTT